MAKIDDTLNHILTQTRAKQNPGGNGWKGHCPSHQDKSPSFSIAQAADGRILLNCHKKCTIDSICAALNITQADLYPAKPKQQTQAKTQAQTEPRYALDKTYDYKDENGTLLFQSVRKRLTNAHECPDANRKKFSQRRPNGKGGWIYNMQGVRRVLYGLPELLASDPAETVWIVEGEKDRDRLKALGLISTCNPMGAGKWLDEYSDSLVGRDCVVIEDDDPQAVDDDGNLRFHKDGRPIFPGQDHAQDVAQSLHGKAKRVRVLSLSNVHLKHDVSDWLDAKHDVAELKQLADALPEWAPSGNQSQTQQSQSIVDATLNRIVTAQTILQTDYPEPKWAVKGVIPEGTTFIAGPPKLGKSIFALNIAVAVSEGGKALSYFDVEQGAVLYLALEDGERRIKKRLEKLVTKPLSDKLEVVTKWPRINQGGLEAIEEWIRRHPDARLLIVDTFKMLRPMRNQNKNANTYDMDYEDVSPLTDLTTQYCIALGIVTHTRKALADDPLATVSGSFGFTGAADGALILTRQRNQRTATLTVIGRDVEEQELALEFRPDRFLWSALGKSSEVRQSNERQEILDLLRDSEEPLTPAEIASMLDRSASANAIRNLLWKMKKAGDVAVFGKQYQLPDYAPQVKQSSKNGSQASASPSSIPQPKKPKTSPASPETDITGDASKTQSGNGLDAVITASPLIAENDISNMRHAGDAVMKRGQTLHTEELGASPAKEHLSDAVMPGEGEILDAIDAQMKH